MPPYRGINQIPCFLDCFDRPVLYTGKAHVKLTEKCIIYAYFFLIKQ